MNVRLSHLTALAVMIALVGAMFVAMGSVSAIGFGACSSTADTTNYLTVGDTCTLSSAVPESQRSMSGNAVKYVADVNPDNDTADEPGIQAVSDGKATFTNKGTDADSADDDTTYAFDVRLEPSIAISFGNDTDAIVAAGTPVAVTVTTKGISAEHDVRIETPAPTYFTAVDDDGAGDNALDSLNTSSQFVTVEHEVLSTDSISTPPTADISYTSQATLSTSGVPAGDYTVTASVSGGTAGAGNVAAGDRIVATKTLTVGDPGANVATAALALAPLDAGNNVVSASKAVKTQSSTVPARGGKVYLTLNVLNSLNNLSNASDAAKLDITVTAIGARLSRASSTLSDGVSPAGVEGDPSSTDGSLQYKTTGPINVIMVERSKPGPVTVSALVVGERGGGYATSDTISLTFSGDVATIDLGEASGTLLRYASTVPGSDGKDTDTRDMISFPLSASDSAGSGTAIPTVTFQITDPDGNNVDLEKKIVPDQDQSSSGVPNAMITLSTKVGRATALATGTYTLKVSRSSKITDTSTFTVVGPSDAISLELSDMTPSEIGDLVEVTATVTDSEGNPAADGTLVDIDSADTSADFDSVLVETGDTGKQKTKAGVVKATFVTVGHGRAVITAVADGKSAVAVVVSAAGAPEPEAMAEEEASVACLSNLSGFTTWSCGVESSASEIFELVSDRRATALHLWNGSAWVRYSVVEGTMVPGSSDFMVTKSDILYISN